ncbi:hypothetical protein ILUMI_05702 [Ignelater luminosus]|uniref:Uncharacterized protein n=1 Tax=Ignelater luminosus TaxID=2038154 RepID=A0A8K0DC32_IGNLU|nr:hypothetical protein ILUMI_05702 [Ignelater luminosus]
MMMSQSEIENRKESGLERGSSDFTIGGTPPPKRDNISYITEQTNLYARRDKNDQDFMVIEEDICQFLELICTQVTAVVPVESNERKLPPTEREEQLQRKIYCNRG